MIEDRSDESKLTTLDPILRSLESGKAIRDDNKQTWNLLVGSLLKNKCRIVALRGAGKTNGADREESDILL